MTEGKSQYQFKEWTEIGVRMHWNVTTSFFPGVRQKSPSCKQSSEKKILTMVLADLSTKIDDR